MGSSVALEHQVYSSRVRAVVAGSSPAPLIMKTDLTLECPYCRSLDDYQVGGKSGRDTITQQPCTTNDRSQHFII